MPIANGYRPDPKILALGDELWDVVAPARFPKHVLRFRNDRAAATIGLDALDAGEWEAAFARFEPLPRNLREPLALRYHGHQFGVYNPHLGDGRGFVFAEVRDAEDRLLDLGTKGSGTTPWSRGGDGRLTLKGGVREILATEMLEALGVPTSRTLSVFETGEKLLRGDEPSPTRSCVLVRLGHAHIRFGTFQRLAYLKQADAMRALLDFCVDAYFPDLAPTRGDERALAFLDRVAARSAVLAARWMAAGFCHGVLNTDNMTITGESFDYGPWRFVPTFDPDFVAAYFDETGLYAFGRQPAVVLWNLGKLADALRLVAPAAPLGGVLATYEDRYEDALTAATLDRLGVAPIDPDTDAALARAAWDYLDSTGIGFEPFFFDVRRALVAHSDTHSDTGVASNALPDGPRFEALRDLLVLYTPRGAPPARERPCTMLIDEVEAIWSAIAERDDFGLLEAKIAEIRAVAQPAIRSDTRP